MGHTCYALDFAQVVGLVAMGVKKAENAASGLAEKRCRYAVVVSCCTHIESNCTHIEAMCPDKPFIPDAPRYSLGWLSLSRSSVNCYRMNGITTESKVNRILRAM
jgi:hypothetical protein